MMEMIQLPNQRGGPGGMEAARVAKLRGHQVILYEKRDELGGVLIEAAVPEFKRDLIPLIKYFRTQMEKLGVEVHTGEEATVETVEAQKPDVIIVATGAKPSLPDVIGIDNPIALNPIEVYQGKDVGDKVVVVGGGMIGSEMGLWLGEMGKEVTITSRQEEVVYGHDVTHHIVLMERLAKAGVKLRPKMVLYEVTDEGVVMQNIARGFAKEAIACDNAIIVAGFTPNRELADQLTQKGFRVKAVGDCVSARMIHDAIYEGHLAARSV
jgi:2-enoate reductase